jgi:hypothetical protein
VCMFCGHAGHLDEFCFQQKRIERRHVEYARTHIVMSSLISHLILILMFCLTFYSRASPRTSSRAFPQFPHGLNHRRRDHFPRRPDFPTGGSFPHFEPRHLDSPRFPHHGSCPTRPSGEVQGTVKTSSGRLVKCRISKIYLTNPALSYRPFLVLCR